MKSLRDQIRKCTANGNLIVVDISKLEACVLLAYAKKKFPIDKINVCIEGKCLCSGMVCFKERGNA